MYNESRRRSKFEIYLDILRVVDSGLQKPTNIMYQCNLSWKPLNEFLDYLMNVAKVIERIDYTVGVKETHDRRTKYEYKLTEKGKALMQSSEKLMSVLGREPPIEAPPVP